MIGEGDLSAPDQVERTQAVENHMKWVDAAVALGCHAIRVNTGGHYSPTHTANASQACGALAEFGASHKISVICENHGGPSSDPGSLIALINAVGKPNLGTLTDFGNFPRKREQYDIDAYDAIAPMMPYARGVSAKSYGFGPAGDETSLDYARILMIVTDSGYIGHVGIEFEGGAPEPDGIEATKKLLECLRGAQYAP
jgi:sugar phosphate isomerase/epimerase